MLIVPGGGWNHKAEHGARKQAELGTLTKMISEMHNAGTIVAGVCTGDAISCLWYIERSKGNDALFCTG